MGGGLELDDLGLHRLKDFPAPQHLYCAVIDGVGIRLPAAAHVGCAADQPATGGDVGGGPSEELAVVTALVGEHRVVTVTGPGWVREDDAGPCRAEQLLDRFAGGAWWVPLATVTDPGAGSARRSRRSCVPTRRPAPVGGGSGRPPGVRAHAAGAGQHGASAGRRAAVQALLHRLPELRVLVTSQVPLGLDRESVFVLGPLQPPAAVDLFIRGARTARPGLTLETADLDAVDAICAALDCQPLAVELAAARMSVLTATQIRDRMFAGEGLLRAPASDARLERHRSLAAEVDWSLSLLDPACAGLFARMGTFAAPASLGDLETVSGDHAGEVLDALDGLVRFALVQRREDGDGVVRFALPEALRQLAVRALDRDPDAQRWRRAHAEHVRAVLEPTRLRHSCSLVEYAAGLRLDADVALAVAWAIRADPELACDIAGLWSFRLMADGQVPQGRELVALVETTPRASRARARTPAWPPAKDAPALGDPGNDEFDLRRDRLLARDGGRRPGTGALPVVERGKARG